MNFKMIKSLLALAITVTPSVLQAQKSAVLWLTNPDKSVLFQRQEPSLRFSKTAVKDPIIDVDDKKTFQSIDGFGFALTGGSAQLLMRMDPQHVPRSFMRCSLTMAITSEPATYE